MKAEFIVNRQGKDFALYQGLLDEAHQDGLKRISTTLIQIPTEDNGRMAIVIAEVETSKGVFSGIGDASPGNVGPKIVPHILRMAETRAKARALRDAINVGATALDELGPDDGEGADDSSPPASERQIKFISSLLAACHLPPLPDTALHVFSKNRANNWIEQLQMAKIDGGAAVLILPDGSSWPPSVDGAALDAAPPARKPILAEVPTGAVMAASPYKPASANQLATIAKLTRLMGETEVPMENMTSADASERITELSRLYNEQKGQAGAIRR